MPSESELKSLVHDLCGALQSLILKGDPQVQLAASICREMSALLSRTAPAEPLQPLFLRDRFADFAAVQPELEAAFGLKLKLTHDLINADCAVWSNIMTARHVSRNLVANAANAGASLVRVHYQEGPTTVQIVFADDGAGMGPCGTGPRASTGGVHIVERLIRSAGGHVSWESRLGIGTWVTILLPKAPKAVGVVDRLGGVVTDEWMRSKV